MGARHAIAAWASILATSTTLAFAGCGSEFSSCEAKRECPADGTSGSGGNGNGSGGADDATGGAGRDEKGGSGGEAGSVSVGGAGVSGGGEAGSADNGGADGEAGRGNAGATGAGATTGQGGTTGTHGEAGAGGEAGGGSRCDPAGSPADLPCLVSEDFAVFVAARGSDANAGTQAAPVQTLTRALDLAGASRAVIACAGTFRESLLITGSARVYGGFSCPSTGAWTHSETPTLVTPNAGQIPLVAREVDEPVLFEDVRFEAQPALQAQGSSTVAALVVNSTEITFRRVDFIAGEGSPGGIATNPGYPSSDRQVLRGNDATSSDPGAAKECQCVNGTSSTGGAGGNLDWGAGQQGLPVTPSEGLGGDGGESAGCFGLTITGPGRGKPGASGLGLKAVATSASELGALSIGGWAPASGSAGPDGLTGQGGGGGRGGLQGGGGGGGCGGCGGQGGPGGLGGGGSIALISIDSQISLVTCTLRTEEGGAGGSGAKGAPGAPGGDPGNGAGDSDYGCDGGAGGAGGGGIRGGDGAGGISVAMLFRGTAPLVDAETTVSVGKAGVGTGDAIDGVAAEQLEVP